VQSKEDFMVNYGEQYEDDAPTSTHIRRHERKFHYHKLSRGIDNQRFQRNHPDHPMHPPVK
jgi:hypothetical protein